MILVVVRHGETNLNKENRLQGSRGDDLPLNETGRKEIEHLRDTLLISPSHIYSSPTRRTQETTAILRERFPNIPLSWVDDLSERDFGTLSGKLRSEVGAEILANDLEGRYDYRPFGGESIDDVTARIKRFVSSLPLEKSDTVLIVTHRGIIRILYELFPDNAGDPILPGTKHVFRITERPAWLRKQT